MTLDTPIRVLIIDDHPLIREGTGVLINQHPNICVVGSAGSGAEGLVQVARTNPDVVLLDIHLPDISGVRVAQQLQQHHPAVRVLVLTGYDDTSYVRTLLGLGVWGYLSKTASSDELISSILAVMNGQQVLRPELRVALAQDAVQLTEREHEILTQLAAGYRNREMADMFGLSIKTVEFYVSRILEKFGARSRTEVIHKAMQRGIIQPVVIEA